MQKTSSILVTGGAGFIGSNLVEALLEQKYNVISLDNFDSFYPKQNKLHNLTKCKTFSSFNFIEGDIRDRKLLTKIFNDYNIDAVIHLAAKAGVRPSILSPTDYIDVNINGTICLLDIMREMKVDKLIYASSSSVYGNNIKVPYSENDNVDHPISPYSASKKASELMIHTYHHLYDFNIINLRFFTVYGPRQRPDLAIHKFFKNLYRETAIDIYGDGNTSRDYTFITDITQGIINSLIYIQNNSKVYEIINLGNSAPVKLSALVETIEKITGKIFIKNYLPMQDGDVNMTFADIDKAKKLINYNPCISLERGLIEFKKWYEESNT